MFRGGVALFEGFRRYSGQLAVHPVRPTYQEIIAVDFLMGTVQLAA